MLPDRVSNPGPLTEMSTNEVVSVEQLGPAVVMIHIYRLQCKVSKTILFYFDNRLLKDIQLNIKINT